MEAEIGDENEVQVEVAVREEEVDGSGDEKVGGNETEEDDDENTARKYGEAVKRGVDDGKMDSRRPNSL